jgi:hypothetical protein
MLGPWAIPDQVRTPDMALLRVAVLVQVLAVLVARLD